MVEVDWSVKGEGILRHYHREPGCPFCENKEKYLRRIAETERFMEEVKQRNEKLFEENPGLREEVEALRNR